MTILQSIILGIIQGLTEFLPVSSSAHLNIFPWFFGWNNIPESFDIALHFGTLLALCIYFFKDWIRLIVGRLQASDKKRKVYRRKNIFVFGNCNNTYRSIKFSFR